MYRPELETAPAETIEARQLARFNTLIADVLPRNAFYRRKLAGLAVPLTWDAFRALPWTTKAELVADQKAHPPLGSIATSGDTHVAYHQTSGTTADPLTVLDSPDSWRWWGECWRYVYAAAGVTARDRAFFAFSFGPFIGFWSALESARALGALAIPGGGMDSKARLRLLLRAGATVLLCTPTYALRLLEVAAEEGLDLSASAVRTTIHAGEPGASIPSVRARIEAGWHARTFDHAGATEVGAYGFSCAERHGLHVNEAEFIAEIVDPASGAPVGDGECGELVLTNLGRRAWPVVRYRTGDLVRRGPRRCGCGRSFLTLPGGLIGRADDLIVLRGVNVYPSAVEAVVRTFAVDEFRLVRTRRGEMDELVVEIEAAGEVAPALGDAFRQRMGVRIETRIVPPGSLPRFELKARRLVDLRDVRGA